MKKILVIIPILIALSFSGCATSLNNTIKDSLNNDIDNSSESYVAKYIESEPESNDNDEEYIGDDKKADTDVNIGESFDASIDIEREDGTKETIGQKGLRYTVNSVDVYENIYESGVEFNAWNLSFDHENRKFYVSEGQRIVDMNNMFILIDMNVSYNAPENGKEEVKVYLTSDIVPTYKEEKMPENWLEEFVSIRKNNIYICCPDVAYYSGAPLPEDVTSFERDDMLPMIKDGETINFQIGIQCWEKFVEYKNLYLQINHFNPNSIEGYDGRYLALFPEE